MTADKGYDTNANHQQLKDNGQRSSIVVKNNRTNPEIIGQANPTSQRERPNIERKFAEQKKYHGLGKVRYWGLARVGLPPAYLHHITKPTKAIAMQAAAARKLIKVLAAIESPWACSRQTRRTLLQAL